MKTTNCFFALRTWIAAAASAFLLATDSAPAQDAKKDAAAAAGGDEAAMMEAYMKLISPGPQHKMLAKLVGDWEATQTLWMVPGAPPAENKGTSSFRMILGGRYLVQTYTAEIPGMGEFTGRGTTAFDNATKEFIQTWIDSFNTGIMVSKGQMKGDKTIELKGESVDPLTKQKVGFRTTSTYIDDNNHEMEMFEIKGGEERKIMKIAYKRVKGAKDKKQAK